MSNKEKVDYSMQVGCWLCDETGVVREMHTRNGILYNCHESCYQNSPQEIKYQIDGMGEGIRTKHPNETGDSDE